MPTICISHHYVYLHYSCHNLGHLSGSTDKGHAVQVSAISMRRSHVEAENLCPENMARALWVRALSCGQALPGSTLRALAARCLPEDGDASQEFMWELSLYTEPC